MYNTELCDIAGVEETGCSDTDKDKTIAASIYLNIYTQRSQEIFASDVMMFQDDVPVKERSK